MKRSKEIAPQEGVQEENDDEEGEDEPGAVASSAIPPFVHLAVSLYLHIGGLLLNLLLSPNPAYICHSVLPSGFSK